MRAAAPLWPLLVYALAALLLVAAMIGLSAILGERHRGLEKSLPYESGIAALGSAQLRISAKFYLIALFFLIFDLEAVFIFAWSVSFREAGWPGYVEMLIFIGTLLVALAYLWRTGGLDWSGDKWR